MLYKLFDQKSNALINFEWNKRENMITSGQCPGLQWKCKNLSLMTYDNLKWGSFAQVLVTI